MGPGADPTEGFSESYHLPVGLVYTNAVSDSSLPSLAAANGVGRSVAGSDPSAFPFLHASDGLEMFYRELIPGLGCSSSTFPHVNF